MVATYQNWRRYHRMRKEAKLLLKEARRILRKFSHRLTDKQAAELGRLERTLRTAAAARDYGQLPPAMNALDRKLDEELSFARKSTVREYSESIAVAILIALLLRAFVVEAFKIPSGSMIPTLQVGDH